MNYKDVASRLKGNQILDAKMGHTRPPTALELEAAEAIESLLFQLDCRIEAARKEATA